MLDIFSGLRLVIKRRPINIDNTIFRFHWFLTSTILVSFSLIITARQYVGQPIECHSIDKIPETLLNSYCWVQSTFTVPQACNQRVGTDVPYPCIDNSRGREIKMFAYYQWVGIVLFIQGILFHLPYYLWKLWEAGLIRAITSGLRVAVLSDIERCKKKDIVIEYLHEHLGCHRSYALKYFLCELCCLINLLLQLWATDKFFDGQFLNYGLDFIRYSTGDNKSPPPLDNHNQGPSNDQQQKGLSMNSYSHHYLALTSSSTDNNQTNPPRIDPMTFIFPRITKCTYYDFGSSGDIQKHDAICLLPLNIVNEKIYIALWFWFLILALLTSVVIVYRFFILFFKGVRAKFLMSRCKLSAKQDVEIICQRGDVGDWFLFYMMAINLDPLIMREIVSVIAERLEIRSEKEKEAMASYKYNGHLETSQAATNLAGLEELIEEREAARSSRGANTTIRATIRPAVSLTKQIRNRFHLRGGFLRGARLFSSDDSAAVGRGAAKKRLKRLNSWQGDQSHLFAARQRHDLEVGASSGGQSGGPMSPNRLIALDAASAAARHHLGTPVAMEQFAIPSVTRHEEPQPTTGIIRTMDNQQAAMEVRRRLNYPSHPIDASHHHHPSSSEASAPPAPASPTSVAPTLASLSLSLSPSALGANESATTNRSPSMLNL